MVIDEYEEADGRLGRIVQNTRRPTADRSLRQIGMREILVAVSIVAMSLGLYQPPEPLQSVVLSTALLSLLWQIKRIQSLKHVSEVYALGAFVLFTLVLEVGTAWFTGTGRFRMLPWMAFLYVFRSLLMLICGTYVLFELVRILVREPLRWPEAESRVGLSGRVAMIALCLPSFFSYPIADASLRRASAAIDLQKLANECEAFSASEKHPILKLDNDEFVLLRELEIEDIQSGEDGYRFKSYGGLRFALLRTSTQWQLYVESHTMPSTVVNSHSIIP